MEATIGVIHKSAKLFFYVVCMDKLKMLKRVFMAVWLILIRSCSALSAVEQALGDWDITFKANRGTLGGETIVDLIFPSRFVQEEARKKQRTLDCRLSINRNGTFSLVPPHENGLPINGWWEIGRNPYCPTDRFYDDLLLQSYARVQKEGDTVLQRGRFSAKCRIYGRYRGHDRSVGRIKHGSLLWQGRLEEGKRNMFGIDVKYRRVCASFTGRTIEAS